MSLQSSKSRRGAKKTKTHSYTRQKTEEYEGYPRSGVYHLTNSLRRCRKGSKRASFCQKIK